MTRKKAIAWAVVLVLAVALVGTVARSQLAAPVAVARSEILPVAYTTGVELLDPGAEAWAKATPIQVPLSGMEIKGEWPIQLIPAIQVQALRDDRWLYFRLSWADATQNDKVTGIDAFLDAVAVQLPITSTGQPYVCMGQQNSPVHIVYWRAGSEQPESLAAGSFGTLTPLPGVEVRARGLYQGNGWQVVLARPLRGPEAGNDPKAGMLPAQTSVAFAVWDGADQQRGGRKATSNWLTLSLQGVKEGTAVAPGEGAVKQ